MDESHAQALGQIAASEQDEVRLARAHDPQIWAQWYDSHYRTLYRYAYFRLGNREEAEDVAAEVFALAFQRIDSYRYQGRPVLAWFYTIARNLVTDHVRAAARRKEAPLEDRPTNTIAFDGQIEATDLRRALTQLKTEQREVVVLRLLLSFSNREVAQMLKKTEAAVHSLQVRGVRALRDQLTK